MGLRSFVPLLAISASTAAGCYWPVPSCEDRHETRAVGVVPLEGGGFRAADRTYGSCKELCADLANVRDVADCDGPHELAGDAGDEARWTVTCKVVTVVCEQPAILEGRSDAL